MAEPHIHKGEGATSVVNLDTTSVVSLSDMSEHLTLPPAGPPAPDLDVVAVAQTLNHRPAESVSLGPPARFFGDYELLNEIARGGMGVVYRARQKGLNRIVALKMILSGKLAGAEETQRFYTEAKAAAQLQHPNIVSIFDVGTHDGQPYFSMEYVTGNHLANQLKEGVLSSQHAARYVEQAAEALAYAHRRGILHRDLKPHNILIDDHDRPKVTDFGLAKIHRTADETSVKHATKTGAVLGTPGYMAPEQASGEKDLGPPCDVYGLGAVLYELLTGRPPFKAETSVDTILQVLNEEPLPPRLLNAKVHPDLENIVVKCLEKRPELRYPTADALAQDLRRFLRGEPVHAQSVNLLDRISRELGHSQHEKHLRPWGFGLMLFGALIVFVHLATSLLLVSGAPEALCYWGPRSVLIVLMGVTLYRYRPHASFWPVNAVERLIWAVWVGYLLGFASLYWVMHLLDHNHLQIYGVSTVLGGLAWFVMGGHVWGWCYLLGGIYFLLGPVLALSAGSNWAPFWFGLLWGCTFLTIGFRYWWLGRAEATEA